MERPEQHVIDSLGQSQLRAVFEPLGWTLAPGVDYGIDFDVEVFRDHKTTGITFKVQLKSHRQTDYSADLSFVSEAIPVKNARYLANEMQVPTVLAHANVLERATFWCAPQLDPEITERIKGRVDDATVTIRIPTANNLEQTIDELLKAITQARLLLAARSITRTPAIDFVSALRKQPEIDSTIENLRAKADFLSHDRAYQLLLAGELQAAERRLRQLIENPETALEIKFVALIALEQARVRQAVREARSDEFRLSIAIETANELRRLTKSGPPHLKFYAILTKKAAEFSLLLHQSWGLYLNMLITRQHGEDPLWITQLLFGWTELTPRINLKMQQCIRLVNYAIGSPHGWAITDPLVRLGKSLILWAAQLRQQDQGDEVQRSVNEKAFELFRLAAEIAKRIGDEQRLADAAAAARLFSGDRSSETYKWMAELLGGIKDAEVRGAANAYLDRFDRRERGEKFEYEIETTEKQIYENMAYGAGINLADSDDPFARLVRNGINDLDPSRVLRNCEHIFITVQTNPLIASTLKLPTAGFKTLHCTKHGYAIRGELLDDAYATFRDRFCAQCQDSSPRPAEWNYSSEWQQLENRKHAEFARAFWGRDPR